MLRLVCSLMMYVLLAASGLGADEVAALLAAGDAYDARLETREALATYLEAEKLAPNNAEVLHRIAKQHGLSMVEATSPAEKQKRVELAMSYAKRAVAADDRNAMGHLCLAICYGRLATFMDAKTGIAYSKLVKEHAERAVELDPRNDLAVYVLGAWHFELAGLGTMKRALAKVLYGQVPPASYEEAVRHFEKARQMNPKRMCTHVELGRTYAAMGKKEEARAALTRSLAMPNREKDDPDAKARAQRALREL